MRKIKSIATLRKMLREFEQAIIENVVTELKRIKRTIPMSELDFTPFSEEVKEYIESIRLDENNLPTLETSFNDVTEKYLSECISANEIDHWNMIALVEQLQGVSDVLKTYVFKGKDGRKDISFTIEDLIPIPSAHFDFDSLAKLVDYSEYEPDKHNCMNEEFTRLYENPEHKGINFFKIKGTEVVIIPGNFNVYATILKEQEIGQKP